jgi:hypothetical protein
MKRLKHSYSSRKGRSNLHQGGLTVPDVAYGSPMLLKKLKAHSKSSSEKIEMRESKDVEKFLNEKRAWEDKAESKPPLQFK